MNDSHPTNHPHQTVSAPPAGWLRKFRHTAGRWMCALFVWVIILEGLAQVAVRIRPALLLPDVSWTEAECFADAEWIHDYFREWRKLNSRWEPYVYWRSRAFDGKYITIGADGNRRTWRPESIKPGAFRVFFFGGSTLWGLGARDDSTIPSLVSRRLTDALGPCVEVVNFGELGFVNTQEMVQLLRELQAGQRPDAVVFYDGVNDVFSASQSGRPGIPQNEYRREKEFNLLRVHGDRTGFLVVSACYHAIQRSAAVRLASRWAGLQRPHAPVEPSPSETARLALGVHSVYVQNLKIIQAISMRMGFDALFYWQPSVFTKPLRTPHEERQFLEFKPLEALSAAVNQRLEACEVLNAMPEFHYSADIFADVDSGVFFDYCHTGEFGNDLLAEQMTQDILGVLEKRRRE